MRLPVGSERYSEWDNTPATPVMMTAIYTLQMPSAMRGMNSISVEAG